MTQESNKVTLNADDLLHVQESMVNLLIRVSAIEKVLQEKNILDADNFKKAIEEVGSLVTSRLQKLYSQEVTQTENTEEKK
jgi:hypothetical protein